VSSNPDLKAFRATVDENFKSWESALRALPRETEDQQLHVGRCFDEFKALFEGTKGWKLFFLRNADRPDTEGLSERSVDAMISAAKLVDWAAAEPDAEQLKDLIYKLMGRGQNYGMLGLAAVHSLPKRYWRTGLAEIKRVGDEKKLRKDARWRERSWRLATLGQDVLRALVKLERPARTIEIMLENPKGYDRVVADAISAQHGDEKRIATITIRKVMEFLSEEISDVLTETDRMKSDKVAAETERDPDLAGIKRLMELPDNERKAAMEKVVEAITKYYETK
jgi:hypothetical protein